MGWLSFLRSRDELVSGPALETRSRPANPAARPVRRRSYAAAGLSRLTSAFPGTFGTGDAELRGSLARLRARSRQLEQDNDLIKRFLHLVQQNVVGWQGVQLKMRARDPATGKLDRDANQRIEDRWYHFLERELFTVSGRLSGIDAQALAVRSAARDGEAFTRLVRGYDNAHRFAVQLLEADLVDEQFDQELSNERSVRLGVEFDRWDRPRGYWLLPWHPGDPFARRRGAASGFARERVDADEMAHLFVAERVTQSRGIPWTHTSATRVDMADGYLEAELVAARVASGKMGFYTTPTGSEYQGDDETGDGAPVTEAEPGTFEELPRGWEFQTFDPQHPTSALEPFLKTLDRRLASGLNVSYHQLANNLENVNFSSGRIGELGDRDFWRALQNWFASNWLDPIFKAWLRVQIDGGLLPLPARKFDAYAYGARWQGRGWAWVDPQKEAKGNREAYELRVKSLTQIALEQGIDFEDVVDEIAEENEKMRARGVTPPTARAPGVAAGPAADPELEDPDEDAPEEKDE